MVWRDGVDVGVDGFGFFGVLGGGDERVFLEGVRVGVGGGCGVGGVVGVRRGLGGLFRTGDVGDGAEVGWEGFDGENEGAFVEGGEFVGMGVGMEDAEGKPLV